ARDRTSPCLPVRGDGIPRGFFAARTPATDAGGHLLPGASPRRRGGEGGAARENRVLLALGRAAPAAATTGRSGAGPGHVSGSRPSSFTHWQIRLTWSITTARWFTSCPPTPPSRRLTSWGPKKS